MTTSLYKLPDEKQSAAGAFSTKTLSLICLIAVLNCWLATQWAAHALGYQKSLGEPLFLSVYSPVDFFIWMIKFGHVKGTARAFDGGFMIVASSVVLIIPVLYIAYKKSQKYGAKNDLHGSAHWATPAEVKLTGLMSEPDGGVYVGAYEDPKNKKVKYLSHDGPEHILAFAPTRSGKGVGLVLPTLFKWSHSVLVHDIKGENWALTAGFRKELGQVCLKFDPTSTDGSSAKFNPLSEIRLGTPQEIKDVQNIATMIVDPDGKGMADHWAKTGYALLVGTILHVLYAEEDKTLRGISDFLSDPERTLDQTMELMLNTKHVGDRPHPVVARSARELLNKSENERSGVLSTAMSFLSLYRDPIVAQNTDFSQFKINDLMNHDTPVSLYLVVPPSDKDRLKPLLRLIINQVVRQLTEKMEFVEGRSVCPHKHRLLLMIDEFPALGKLDIFQESLAFIAGYGLKAYLIVQDLSQLYAAYGRDEAVVSNCHIRVAYAPNKLETAELLSKMVGSTTVLQQQRSYSGKRFTAFLSNTTASVQMTARSLLTADETSRMPPEDQLIFVAGFPPIYGKKIIYYRDKNFNEWSKIPAPLYSDFIHIEEKLPEMISTFDDSEDIETTSRTCQYTDEEIAELNAENSQSSELGFAV